MKLIEYDQALYRPLRLRAGESLHIPLRAGTTVQVLAGALRVSEPARWLAETVVRPAHQLGEGQWLQVADGGWLDIEASAVDVHLMLAQPPEAMAWLWRRLRALLRTGGPACQQA